MILKPSPFHNKIGPPDCPTDSTISEYLKLNLEHNHDAAEADNLVSSKQKFERFSKIQSLAKESIRSTTPVIPRGNPHS